MIYLIENLSEAYEKLKDINIDNNSLKIYSIPLGDEIIKIDINKTIEDLKYISSTDKNFYLLEFEAPDTLKKLTELSLDDWKKIFFNFNGESEYSIFSDNLTPNEYKKIIQKINKKYSKKETDSFFKLYILVFTLLLLSRNIKINNSNNCIEKYVFENKNGILNLVNKKFPNLSKDIEMLFDNKFFDDKKNLYLKSCYREIKKEAPFFVLSKLTEKNFLSFLSLFHFVIKPLEKISYEDIKNLFKNLCHIEGNIPKKNLGKNLIRSIEEYENQNTIIDNIKILFDFGNEKLSLVDLFFEKMYRKFNLLEICALEKIYRYISLNLDKYKDIKILLKDSIFEVDFKVKIDYSKEKVSIKNLWKEYLDFLENIEVEKSFYFSNFFRMQLFYRKEILKNLTFLISYAQKIFYKEEEKNFYKKLGIIKGNFNKLKYSQREMGQDNYERIVSFYEYLIFSLEKNENKISSKNNLIEELKKNRESFIIIYMLLQRYKLIYDIKIKFEVSNNKMNFIRYNDYINLVDIYDFKISSYKDNIDVLDMIVVKFLYQKKELNYWDLNENRYYVVEPIDNSKDIFLLQYIGKFNDELLFRNNFGIKSYLPEKIKIRKIKYLEFLEDEKRDTEISLL